LPSPFRIHPVFHVSQLEPIKVSKLFSREEEKVTIPVESGTNDEFEIERILGERKRYRRKEYLIKWKGYPSEENSWVPEYSLTNALEVLVEFYNSQRQQLARAVVTDRVSESLQCKARTKQGTRCKRRTRKGDYCWTHMENNLNVRVNSSTIPHAGFGVFTVSRTIEEGKNTIPYEGELKPVNGGDYTLQINQKQMIDAAKSRYLGGFINDCREFQRRKRF